MPTQAHLLNMIQQNFIFFWLICVFWWEQTKNICFLLKLFCSKTCFLTKTISDLGVHVPPCPPPRSPENSLLCFDIFSFTRCTLAVVWCGGLRLRWLVHGTGSCFIPMESSRCPFAPSPMAFGRSVSLVSHCRTSVSPFKCPQARVHTPGLCPCIN